MTHFLPLEFKNCLELDLGKYQRTNVGNLTKARTDNSFTTTLAISDNIPRSTPQMARLVFDQGLMHLFGFHHEQAAKCFSYCVHLELDCALAHGMLSLCHSPNYNFSGGLYYESSNHPEDTANCIALDMGPFPSQQRADFHSRLASKKVSTLQGTVKQISDVECQIIAAIRNRTQNPGIDPLTADEALERPYANALRALYQQYTDDPEVAFLFADSLMVLNAWNLYEFPSGRPLSPDVNEVQVVLEDSLRKHPTHPGLCHLYVHLSEMSNNPGRALAACKPLRTLFPDLGHLIHMPTHIDVLLGDYESVVRWNISAIQADQRAMTIDPDTSGVTSFYFGYIAHNFHMLVYGVILGAFEEKGMEYAEVLNTYLNEALFLQHPMLAGHLESFSAPDIHVLVRFGRWNKILELNLPQNSQVMLYRTAATRFARAIAYSSLGNVSAAKEEADLFDAIQRLPEAGKRTLHNNVVSDLLNVESKMMRGEISYREGEFNDAFALLREAVALQDELKYDEPWGVMQPVRHALGGLLFEQGHTDDAEEVFRADLGIHPRNPWSMCGLISCLEAKLKSRDTDIDENEAELRALKYDFSEQRDLEWADFEIKRPCECCGRCCAAEV